MTFVLILLRVWFITITVVAAALRYYRILTTLFGLCGVPPSHIGTSGYIDHYRF